MTVFLALDRDVKVLQIMAPAISENGAIRGKLRDFIQPGESFLGHSYEALVRLGNGKHELEPAAEASGPAAS